MRTIGFEGRVLSKVIDDYIRSRKDMDRPFSIVRAAIAVRSVIPSMELSDEELGSAIATSAIAHGRNVYFDMKPAAGAVLQRSGFEEARADA